MKVCFDTSVTVPAVIAAHPAHARAICWIEAVTSGQIEGLIAWHGAAETWAVLTRLPSVPPVGADAARRVVERLVERLRPIAMSARIYQAALRRCAEKGVRSGAIFDALHLVAAEDGGADVLLTLNPGDFQRLAVAETPRIVVPPDPPRVLDE